MHDCPRCQVPLHGHEQFCPSCGTKQYVRQEFRSFQNEGERAFNPLPLALGAVLIGIIVIVAAQNSWIGQVMRRGPVTEDPIAALSPQSARQSLEQQILANLASAGATGKLSWMAEEKPVDRSYPQSVELTIDTKLQDPKLRRNILDPVKQLMAPGKVSTITMNDAKSHATWTYSVAPSLPDDKPEEAEEK